MNDLIQSFGYVFDQSSHVWHKSDYAGIPYSDGDEVENRIAAIIAGCSDLSVLSAELRRHCLDWPTTYHLSSKRANLLRPLTHQLGGDVLEIGAGCGAITRYLGENGTKVVALEGSLRRAAIARSRTRDLDSVTVLSDNFMDFPHEFKFDVITLIGVLEYANHFVSGEYKHLEMLAKVRKHLKPGGTLILAIENQLGLKYFAGSAEDHLGIAMYGLERRYQSNEPQTFGRKELTEILCESGFEFTQFASPLPDYKLPTAIVTQAGFESELFDPSVFAVQSVNNDELAPEFYSFSPELVWPEVIKNELGMDLANSFLVVASASDTTHSFENILGYYYSTERKPNYCKETRFVQGAQNDISVCSDLLLQSDSVHVAGTEAIFDLKAVDSYRQGRSLYLELHGILQRENWTLDELVEFAELYVEAILKITGSSRSSINSASLDGRFLDLVPQNIIRLNEDGFEAFDLEWVAQDVLSFKRVFFRGLFVSFGAMERCSVPSESTPTAWKEIILLVAKRCGLEFSEDDYSRFLGAELAFRTEVSGKAVGTVAELESYLLPIKCGLEQKFREAVSQVENLHLEQSKAIVEYDLLLQQHSSLLSSNSWRATRPFRFALRLLRSGLSTEDWQVLNLMLRRQYHKLPLPQPIKKALKYFYRNVLGKGLRATRRRLKRSSPFMAPTIAKMSKRNDHPDYIVWGVIDWRFRHQRPQQLGVSIAETGRRVFYISPLLRDDERPGFAVDMLDLSQQVCQITLFARGDHTIYSDLPTSETVDQLKLSIGELLKWADSEQIVSLVNHAFWYKAAAAVPNSRLVYDCMDHHAGFENTDSALLDLEVELLRNADLTVVTSDWLRDSVAEHVSKSIVVRNATDFEHFSIEPTNCFSDPEGRKILGYFGAIAEWFDVELIELVAAQFPHCLILLVGADTVDAKSRLGKFANVQFVGEVPYERLPYFLHSFDVCLLPFIVSDLTLATNPVKVYEYLSAGKAVVAVDLPEMRVFQGLLSIAENKELFLSAITSALEENDASNGSEVESRIAFAKAQTWANRADSILQEVEASVVDSKVSVVVVTYNNLKLTQECLESLLLYSQYKNLELIVVDNNSSDDTPAFLTEWAEGNASRKIVLNDDNLGFAAANNQGLLLATGDYLVLLNNDTYVTPGWVRTLMNHMKRDTALGLLGPVTNNIGNEARVEIDYTDMPSMLERSAEYTRAHVGQLYPLRTAAFFCVMMPRAVFEKVGLLDEDFGRGFFEDDDYCRRVEQEGYRIACADDVFIHHHLSASFDKMKQSERKKLFEENKLTYEKKWGAWVPHTLRVTSDSKKLDVPEGPYLSGVCNVCGQKSHFSYPERSLWRETLNCQHCVTTSRYRSLSRGLLMAVSELRGIEVGSLSELPAADVEPLAVYDTQPPFYYLTCAYPLPDLLSKTGWIDVSLSQYRPGSEAGAFIAKPSITNQNLEALTYADESFDIVITSDVMEHVRLDDRAHREIYRVLKPGGIYIFTVPHDRLLEETLVRVQVDADDPENPEKDVHLLEPEYHGDTNSETGGGVLSYRVYGLDLDEYLRSLGFEIVYFAKDAPLPEHAIMNTELFYCRKTVQ